MQPLIDWLRANPWETMGIAYTALSVLNGVLDQAAPQSTAAKVVHALLDRLSPFTRRDALGTFKLPMMASRPAVPSFADTAADAALADPPVRIVPPPKT